MTNNNLVGTIPTTIGAFSELNEMYDPYGVNSCTPHLTPHTPT
jgi:hypothetical protein